MNITIRVQGNYRHIERISIETESGGFDIVSTASTTEDQLLEVMKEVAKVFVEKMMNS